MNSNREQHNDYMVDFRERSALTHDDGYARNEINEQQVNNNLGDFESLLYYAPQEEARPQTVPAPKAYELNETEDTMPSATTMAYRSHSQIKGNLSIENPSHLYEYESLRAREEDKQYKINSKGKVLMAVYAIVVLTIFALIVLNTRLLRNMNNDVAMMENRIQALQTQQQELQDELSFVSSDAEIERKAIEMGMSK